MKCSVFMISLLIGLFLNFKILLAINIDADKFANQYYESFLKYFEENVESDSLKNMTDIILNGDITLIGFPSRVSASFCLLCYSLAESVLKYQKSHGWNEKTKDFAKILCKYIQILSATICDNEIDIEFPYVKYAVVNGKNFTAEKICGIIFQNGFCVRKNEDYLGIEVEKTELKKSKKFSFTSAGSLTILHLTDLHYDPLYVPGSETLCEDLICCRGSKTNTSTRAGYWGDYHICDTPGHVIESILQHAASTHKIDLVYLTGDYIDHHSWNISKDYVKTSLNFTMSLIKKYLSNVPVYPALGNHDGYPSHMFTPINVDDDQVSINWLYKYTAELWNNWLPKDALQTFKNGGFYTVLVKQNFRVIVLNSNVCYRQNLWLGYDDFYFRDQLTWLVKVLKASTDAKEKVHILSHIPSNTFECYRVWTAEFKKIVERFAPIIAGQFNGHTHNDEFFVFYSEENPNVALNVAWNAGSGTTFTDLNTNYRILYVDDVTYEVLDYDTWIFNLTEANLFPSKNPVWYKEYSFRTYFGVEDMSPFSIDKLIQRFKTDEQLLLKYWKINIKESDPMYKKGCDEKCRVCLLQSLVTSKFPEISILYTSFEARHSFPEVC